MEQVEVGCGTCGVELAGLRCSRCRAAWYCSKQCQRSDWKQHKLSCQKTEAPDDVPPGDGCWNGGGYDGADVRVTTLSTVPGFVLDGFAGLQVCTQLRNAMDAAMADRSHRGGYCLVYPDSASDDITPQARAFLGQVRGSMRRACERLFGLKQRLWVGGSLMSRITAPAPLDGQDTCPTHNYTGLHVDQFNLHFYHYSALLYLSETGDDFDGGAFEFVSDPRLQECESQEGLDEVACGLYGSNDSNDIPGEMRTPIAPQIGSSQQCHA
eukprot:TRINITY_DN3368_c0_g1_i6.p1 TRINITY_DN3368_c0_g1~~TRINITY_DN3368_c0_g1_i6.p1  ORF type:complete len:268 (+),score=35.33 TRINITY_DN3368_c0_g1_i6:134-937(+)